MPTAVITGCAGFLGSHLTDRFLDDGWRVVGLDNLLTGTLDNLAHRFGHEGFRFINQDVTDFLHVGGPVDAVLHFASPASPPDYLKYPIQTMKVGALGTHKALGLAKTKGARFLLASTSEVYGDPLEHPQTESYWGHVNPIGPRGVYDEAKRFAESLTMAYHREYAVETRIVRIFNTYGPRMRLDDGRVVPNFMGQILRGEALTVYGDGKQTRSFCYVDDLIEGITRILADGDEKPYNCGNPIELNMLELADVMSGLAGVTPTLVHQDLPVDDPKVRCPNISRASTELGWSPQVSLEDGVRRTYEHFRAQTEAN